MTDDVIPYHEMCRREGASLHRGMQHGLGRNHSVILIPSDTDWSRENRLEGAETILVYQGHDELRRAAVPDPKAVDQPEFMPRGRKTQNGLFRQAAEGFKTGCRLAERVRIYQKLQTGVWCYCGVFHLIDSWREDSGSRKVFKFRLLAVPDDDDISTGAPASPGRRRIIPTWVKRRVWQRDGGKCAVCGATERLGFDRVGHPCQPDEATGSEQVRLTCVDHRLVHPG